MSEDLGLKASFGADTSGLEAALNKLTGQLSDFATQAKTSSDQLGQSLEDQKGSASGLGDKFTELAGAIVAAFSVEKIVEFGSKCKDAFEEAQQAGALLEFAVTKISGGSEKSFRELVDWTEEYSKSLNNLYTPKELQGAEKQLSLLGLNTEQIKKLLPAITDYAQATGKALPEATEAAVAAINGKSRALKDIGGQFKDTGDMLGNYNMLLEKFKVVQGAATAEMNTAANQEKEMNNQMEEQEEKIGSILTPAWLKLKSTLVDFFATAVSGLQSVNDAIDEADNKVNKTAQADSFKATGEEVEKYQAKLKAAGETQAQIAEATKKYLMDELNGYKQVADEAYKKGDYKGQAAASASMNGVSDYINKQYGGGEKDNLAGKATGGKEPKDATDKIKTLDEIIKEATLHMQAFGETKATALKKEIEEVQGSMQKLFEKGQQNTDEFKQMGRALEMAKLQQASLGTQTKGPTGITGAPEEAAPDVSAIEQQGLALAIQGQKDYAKAIESANSKLKLQENEQKIAAQAAIALGKGLAAAMTGQKVDLGSEIMKQLGELAQKKGEGLMAMGAAELIVPGMQGIGALEIAGGVALTAIGAKMAATKMASGGIVSGSAFVNVGEYPGAAHNPEVIAPLDKLKQHMGGGGTQNHTFHVEGPKLVTVMNKVNTNTMFHIGGGGA